MKQKQYQGRKTNVRRRLKAVMMCLGLMSTLVILVSPVHVKAETELCVEPDGLYGCLDNIQDAINSIDIGGTVYVYEGTYNETLTISKHMNLVGNSSTNTSIGPDGAPGLTAIKIDSGAVVNVSGFAVKEIKSEAFYGVYVVEDSMVFLRECYFENMGHAVVAEDGGILRVDNNTFLREYSFGYYAEYPLAISIRHWNTGTTGNGALSTVSNNTIVFEKYGWGIHESLTPISVIENNSVTQSNSNWVCDRNGFEHSAAIVLYQWDASGSTKLRFNSLGGFCWGISTEGAVATIEGGWINNTAVGIGLARRGTDNVEADLTIEEISIDQSSDKGIHSTIASKLTIGNSSVTNSSNGIVIRHTSTASIYDCNVSSNGVGIKTYSGTTTEVTQSEFWENGEGFHSEGMDTISWNEFHLNDEGIRVQGNPSSGNRHISNNTITQSRVRAGIWVMDSSNSEFIQNNEISEGYRGIWVTGASQSKTIRWNNITLNSYGIQFEPSESVSPSFNPVKSNNISMNDYGIYVLSSNGNTLYDNNISGNRNTGIYLDSVYTITVEQSNISNNYMGIVLREDQVPPTFSVSVTKNSILGNTLWAINSTISNVLDAQENFFGAWNKDTIEEMLSGSINYYPWLGFRESNVDIITMKTIPSILDPFPYYVERGMIVNGTLQIGSNADIIFNNSLGQNFIQIVGSMTSTGDSSF